MKSAAHYSDVGACSNETPNYDVLMTEHAPLVKRIAYHVMGRLPSNVQLDDMIQAGMIGLFEALKAYDTSRGASFETYARIRIQGAMIDEVRRCDWTPRSVYKKSRDLSEAVREVEEREGRDARDSEVAEVMGLNMDEYNAMVKDAAGCQVLSFDEIAGASGPKDENTPGHFSGPYQELQQDFFRQGLAENIAGLPERERLVMALYYDEEFNLREIGEILGVTEGRVCQIHGQALVRLRARMTDWVEQGREEA
ncbi:MAG TPA: RNA polymerase sigma factor FliA [Thiotrichales bacterium]|nr:RNA polymerase sigma factor FliA [Thiotrichales bacterium]